MNLRTLGSTTLPLLVLLGPTFAHDDDPKILNSRLPTPGDGWQAGDSECGGEHLAGFDSDGVELLSWMTLGQLDGSGGANDCWGYTSPSGREYAIIGTFDSTCFVEITDPTSPQLIDTIAGPNSLWRDIKVYQDHAYAVSEGGSGIQVMSMANIDNGTVSFVRTVNNPGTSSTHNVAIDTVSARLYRTGGSNEGLRIYDLSNPALPTYMGTWSTRYVHDAQVVTYTSGTYAGRQIAFCFSGFNGGWDLTGLDILDVTNPSSVIQMARILYPDNQYSHQGWLTPDRRYLYLGDELDEDGAKDTTTHIFDVQDLQNPSYLGAFDNNNSAVGHNMYSKGDLLYEANYTSGMRVFDISNPTSPVETAYFDTSSLSGPIFNGLWSCYPYFSNGVVIGSDRESGLFVWRVGELCTAGNYCTANQNSSGLAANIGYSGSLDIPTNDFGLFADSAPPGQFGIFFYGQNQVQLPFGNGFRCVGGGLTRLPLTQTDAFGIATQAIDFNNLPNGGELNPGDQTNFQFWFRDPMGGGSRFNTSDALHVQFCE